MKTISAGILLLILSFNGTGVCQNFWEQTSGPEGGWTRCIAVDKQNTIYAGFNGGEFGYAHNGNCFYKSQDAGLTWQSLPFIGNKDIQSIAIDTNNTIFVWSGYSGAYKSTDGGSSWLYASNGLDVFQNARLGACRNNYIILGYNYGVYVTTNSGTTWNLSALTDPVHSLYTDINDNIFAGINYGGLFKSSDYGASWIQSDYGLNGEVNEILQLDESVYFAGTNEGVYISSDSCSSWNLLAGSPAHITALAKGAGNEIFAATSDNGFYISTNMGTDWQSRNNELKNTHLTSLASFQGNAVITGTYGDGLFISNSMGQSWQSIISGIKCIHATSFLRYKQYLFTGSEEGMLYKSTDLGDSWTRYDSTYTYMPVTAFMKTGNNSLFFASWGGPSVAKNNYDSPTPRVFKSTDEGSTWNEAAQIYVNSFANYYDQNSGTEYLLAAADNMGIRISTDDGNTWYPANNGIDDVIQDVGINSSGIFFASSPIKIYRSTDFGASWQTVYVYTGLSYKIVIAVSDNDYIYAGFDWGSVALSTDNGNNWTLFNLPFYGINSIITDSLNQVYLGTVYGQISQSFDYGQHWTDITTGMIGGPVTNLECDNEGNIFVGPYGGSVYRGVSSIFVPQQVKLAFPLTGANNVSLTPELQWHPSGYAELYEAQVSLNNSFDSAHVVFSSITTDTSCIVDSLEIYKRYYWRIRSSNRFGYSLWSQIWTFKTINPSHTNEEDQRITYFELAQNYPNPFNPETKIMWQTPVEGRQIIKLYNILGEEIRVLTDEFKTAGRYEIRFNVDGLPSGVYFYKLTAGSYSAIKKMVILK